MTSDPNSAQALPHVSVIVPCYNRADEARAAIESVLEQDYPSFDVIAVDDQSTDNTWDVINAISAPNYRVVRNARGKGVSGARNTGVDATQGPWVAFQDSDDLWRPGKLAAQMQAALAMHDSVAVYCAMEICNDGARTGRVPADHDTHLSGDILPGLTLNSFISTQTVVIRRDVYAGVGGFDEALNALVDWELMLRVAQHGPVAYVDEELVEQRMSGNSITNSTERRLKAQEFVLAKHRALFEKYPDALARYHNRIAGGHRQFGRPRQALGHAWAAVKTDPKQWKYWASALRVGVLSLKP